MHSRFGSSANNERTRKDGHSGYQTSRLLSSTLVTYVAQELDLVFRSARPYSDLLKSLDPGSPVPSSSSKSSSFLSIFSGSSHPTPELDSYDPIISTAMKNAFTKLDTEIVSKPVKMLEQAQKDGLVGPRPKDGTMSPAQIEALNALIPALSGSCALLAFLDAGRNKWVFSDDRFWLLIDTILHLDCMSPSLVIHGL